MKHSPELRLAAEAVRRAMRVTLAVRRELAAADTLTKDDRSPVTVADYAAQAVVAMTLVETGLPIVGEETAEALRTTAADGLRERVVRLVQGELPSGTEERVLRAIDACSDSGGGEGRRWVLDPVDGTKGFLRGGQYAIALALLEDGVPIAAALGCPALDSGLDGEGCLFLAETGSGACEETLAGDASRAVRVAAVAEPREANFCESVEAAHSAHERHAEIARRLGVTHPPLRMDSQCKYASLARGDAAIYLRLPSSATYVEKIWDHAAGWLILREAGGEVTDASGRPLDFGLGRRLEHNRGVVATNARLHERVLEAVAATAAMAPQADSAAG